MRARLHAVAGLRHPEDSCGRGPGGAVILAEGESASKCGANETLRSANEKLLGEIDFEEEKSFVVEHERKIGNFEAGVREPVEMMIHVEIKEAVSGRVRSDYFGAEGGGADHAGKRLPIFIARRLSRRLPGTGKRRAEGSLAGLEEDRVGDLFGGKRLEVLARAAGFAHEQANGGRG